jgi:hypothetical protein
MRELPSISKELYHNLDSFALFFDTTNEPLESIEIQIFEHLLVLGALFGLIEHFHPYLPLNVLH